MPSRRDFVKSLTPAYNCTKNVCSSCKLTLNVEVAFNLPISEKKHSSLD